MDKQGRIVHENEDRENKQSLVTSKKRFNFDQENVPMLRTSTRYVI